ncbi:MAG: Tetratricopeptide (TPR) repeat [Verrucomicrobia bacterium]|jgi:outer membrane protein assembly factor BamD (BamD/ComL family)|nr:MAG: Tetratricopeptide (TPR) repeat [Verrucomicrobiota bacterium]
MKSLSLLAIAGLCSLIALSPARAERRLFGKGEMKEVPASEELQRQDGEAKVLLDKAIAAKNGGKLEKAEDLLKDVAELYPLTSSTGVARFELGRVYEEQEKPIKAFDAYQAFIENHRESDLYGEAIRRQFELASFAMNGKADSLFGLIPAKSQSTKVIEMFEKVAANAPRSSFAPQAIFNVGLLQREAEKDAEAIAAFQKLQDNYPADPKTKEAALQIIGIREGRKTNDDSQVLKTQLEMEKFIADFGTDPRASELQEKVGQLEHMDADKKFGIARYYERKGNLKAAAIYYQEIGEGTSRYPDAQKRLAELKAIDPNLIAPPSAPRSRVIAQENVVDRPDYNGPPAPKLEAPAKPQMRASAEDVLPIPAQ